MLSDSADARRVSLSDLPGACEGAAPAMAAPKCKICGEPTRLAFGLPHNKRAGHPIPDEPDDTWYYQCTRCEFLFTPALDAADHTKIYDETYWNNQDPDWYGRVGESIRLVLLANELLRKRADQIEILDFGCGMGCFVDRGRNSLQMNVWGTDINRPRFGTDFFLPDLGDKKFDVILACEVIEHLPDPVEMYFKKAVANLQSPGVIAFQTAQWVPELGRDWWYLGPHNGHISLQSRGSLEYIYRTLGGKARRLWRDYPGVQAWLFA